MALLLLPLAASADAPNPPAEFTPLDACLARLGALVDSLTEASSFPSADSLSSLGLQLVRDSPEPGPLRLAHWLSLVGMTRTNLGRFDEAQDLLLRALVVPLGPSREEREELLEAQQRLYSVRMARQDLPEAEACARQCIALAEEIHGKDGAELAQYLVLLAETYTYQDRPKEAEALLDKAICLVEDRWGLEHEDLADLLTVRALLAQNQGEYEKARSLYERSIAVKKLWWGPESASLTVSMSGLANVYRCLGDFASSEQLYRRCLEIRERLYGRDHPRVATILNNLAVLLNNIGDYAGAVDSYRRCLAIRTRALGEDNPEVAMVLLNLSGPLKEVGDYAGSIRALRKALQILETTRGPERTQTAVALIALGDVLQQRGSLREAEALHRRALAVYEKASGPHHPEVPTSLLRIGRCLKDQGRLNEARSAFQRAIDEAGQIYGADNYRVGLYRREMADLLLLSGRPVEARAVYEECLRTLQAQLGANHPVVVACLGGLTTAYLDLGLLNKAVECSALELSAAERAYGHINVNLVRTLSLGLAVDASAHRWEEAVGKGIRASETALAIQEDLYTVSSEREAVLYARLPQQAAATLLAVTAAAPVVSDTTLSRVFSLVVRTHAQVLSHLAWRRQVLASAADTSAVGRLHLAFAAAAQRAANLAAPRARENQEEMFKELSRARQERDEAERVLLEASERFRLVAEARRKDATVTAVAMAGALDPGATFVQFVRFPVLTGGPGSWRTCLVTPTTRLPQGAEERYGAFRLRAGSGRGGSLRFLDLGEAASIDSLIARYRTAVEDGGRAARPSVRAEAEFRRAAEQLYQSLWAPLLSVGPSGPPQEAGVSAPMVFLVPDSRLHLVDFNSLLSPEGNLVIERWKVHTLSSGRDLLQFSDGATRRSGRGLLAVGNPAPLSSHAGRSEAGTEGGGSIVPCFEALGPAASLPGAAQEVSLVSSLFAQAFGEPRTVLLGEEATEGALKEHLEGRRIVHLATHGFFCRESSPRDSSRDEDGVGNPLLMSGLLLSPGPGDEDGVLTAEDITGFDLRGLNWVVLSACNSGLGSLVPGEGLFGLCRAFEMAGARSVITTLWGIRDDVGRNLMERIYRDHLSGGSTVDAIRQAELGLLQESRTRFNRVHPTLWGGVVAQGDWR